MVSVFSRLPLFSPLQSSVRNLPSQMKEFGNKGNPRIDLQTPFNENFNMSTVEEIESFQLRMSLLALHRRVLFFGPQRNFYMLLALLMAATVVAMHFFPSTHFLIIFIFVVPGFAIHNGYFIDLPRTKSVLSFFEHNHPELCSWLPESALLEAKLESDAKAGKFARFKEEIAQALATGQLIDFP